MHLILISTVVLSALPAPAQADQWDDCKYEETRSLNVSAADARLLEVDAGSGSLTIKGKPGATTVTMRGRACASHQDLLEGIKLEGRRDGSTVVVKSNAHDNERKNSYRNNHYARLDLVIEVPAGMAANIDDGSGGIELSGLGAVDLDDGSGEIKGTNLGSIRIDDGSGEIDLVDIHGKVDIQDGSGEIVLRNIDGPIDIDDNSGEINVRVAKGTVRISDSSGSISVADIAGDFIVTDDGSGGIDYDNVRGRVDIPRKRR